MYNAKKMITQMINVKTCDESQASSEVMEMKAPINSQAEG
jgi:hypothetical protein